MILVLLVVLMLTVDLRKHQQVLFLTPQQHQKIFPMILMLFSSSSTSGGSGGSGGSSGGSSSSSGVNYKIGIGETNTFNVASLLADLRTSELGN